MTGRFSNRLTARPLSNRDVKAWNAAYLVDVPNGKVGREVDRGQLLSAYRIKEALATVPMVVVVWLSRSTRGI